MTDEILEEMAERKEVKRKNDRKLYEELDRSIRKKCKEAKERWWNRKCADIEELEMQHKSKEMYDKVKEVTGSSKKTSNCECIRDKDGNMLFDRGEITSRWVEYVSELYDDNRKEPPDIIEIEVEEILISEVEKAIRDLKTGKACGKDGITTEMIKALDENGIKAITDLCNKIYNTGVIPSDLNDSVFVRLPKKAKATDCNEYRTLSLISHVFKVLLRVILLPNRSTIEKELSETQSGFISGKGTREGIFNMRTICERYLDVNKKVFACFIDYEKAFDQVNHEKLIECLDDIGIRGKDLRFITNLYWTQRAYIQMTDSLSPEVKIKRGVSQGCVLSPCLFNLYTEKIFRHIEHFDGVKIGGVNINNLRYADDTVLLSESEQQLQQILDSVNTAGKEFGVKMNAKKTKTMLISRDDNKSTMNITIDGTPVEQVNNFCVSGSTDNR